MRGIMPAGATLLALLASGAIAAGEITLTDGDGFRIGGERIRLWGIDAPELHQQCARNGTAYACGQEAREALRVLIRAGEVSCEALYEDRYDRTVARCSVNGMDLGAAMVRQGWALDFERYSDGAYAEEEAEAHQAQRGLWAGEFELPAQWRRTH